jgi:hypothetical protein
MQKEKDHSNPAQVGRLKEYAEKRQLEEPEIFEKKGDKASLRITYLIT